MIYDHISNIATYHGLSSNIALGLDFLKQMNPDTPVGEYQINQEVKAIVSEYTTKHINENGYEAHRDCIDIQYIISGEEVVRSLPLVYLKEINPYNKDCDAAFYVETDVKPQELLLGNGYFAILYPQDGHMPQLCVNEPQNVKKVVVKVRIGE